VTFPQFVQPKMQNPRPSAHALQQLIRPQVSQLAQWQQLQMLAAQQQQQLAGGGGAGAFPSPALLCDPNDVASGSSCPKVCGLRSRSKSPIAVLQIIKRRIRREHN